MDRSPSLLCLQRATKIICKSCKPTSIALISTGTKTKQHFFLVRKKWQKQHPRMLGQAAVCTKKRGGGAAHCSGTHGLLLVYAEWGTGMERRKRKGTLEGVATCFRCYKVGGQVSHSSNSLVWPAGHCLLACAFAV